MIFFVTFQLGGIRVPFLVASPQVKLVTPSMGSLIPTGLDLPGMVINLPRVSTTA